MENQNNGNNNQQQMGQRPMNNGQQQMGQQRPMNNGQAPMGNMKQPKAPKAPKNTNGKDNSKILGIVGLVVAQILTVAASVSLYLFTSFETMITMACIGGIVLVDLVATIFIVKATFKDAEVQGTVAQGRSRETSEISMNDYAQANKPAKQAKVQQPQQKPVIQQENININQRSIVGENTFNTEETTLLYNNETSDETALLDSVMDVNRVLAYLKGKKEGEQEIITINKPEFTLGRMKTTVDYAIANQAVGKQHAQIVFNNDKFYIKDLESKNGTYVNKNRVKAEELYPINENDTIVLANSEYVFKLA